MANEQVTDGTGADILLTAMYKAYEDIARYNNKGMTVIVGAIASTGNATTNGATYTHKKPIGSPSSVSRKTHFNICKDGM